MINKRCKKCGEVKEVTEFNKKKNAKDGLQSYCRVCTSLQALQWKQANPEKSREIARRSRNNNLEKRRESVRRWRRQNSDKIREYASQYREVNPEKVREATRQWQKSNREYQREYASQYREVNPEKVREATRQWREANPDKIRETSRRWIEANREKKRETDRRRRARKNAVTYAVPVNIEEILFDVQNGYCLYCQKELLNGYHVDHILPLVLSDLLGEDYPGHIPSNLCLTCIHCNVSKKDALLEDWLTCKYSDQMDEILQRVERHVEIMREWE
jgi:Asp-tRNA(Asn)/Glu-tRNA(Gln) amidotransferase C subunit